MSSCPFVAIQQATGGGLDPTLSCPISGKRAPTPDGSKSSNPKPSDEQITRTSSGDKPKDDKGRRSPEMKEQEHRPHAEERPRRGSTDLGEGRERSAHSKRRSSVAEVENWKGVGVFLGSIMEEPEGFNDDDIPLTFSAALPPLTANLPELLHHHQPFEEEQQTASDFEGSVRSGSQIGSVLSDIDMKIGGTSRISKGQQSARPSSKSSAKRKKMVARMREICRTTPPTYSLAELRQHAPAIKSSWAMLIEGMSWDQLGVKLYESIFQHAPSLQEKFSRSSVAMGIKMVDMIDSMVTGLDDMAGVHKKMESLGPVHYRNSVHAMEHMHVFEKVIIELFTSTLGDRFAPEMQKGWHWLWNWLTQSMYVVEQVSGVSRVCKWPQRGSFVCHVRNNIECHWARFGLKARVQITLSNQAFALNHLLG